MCVNEEDDIPVTTVQVNLAIQLDEVPIGASREYIIEYLNKALIALSANPDTPLEEADWVDIAVEGYDY